MTLAKSKVKKMNTKKKKKNYLLNRVNLRDKNKPAEQEKNFR